MNKTLTYGLILGVVMIAFTLLQYSVGGLSAGMLWSLLSFAVMIGLLVFFGTKLRAANGGFASFGKMFGWLMIMSVVSSVLVLIFNFVYMSMAGDDIAAAAKDSLESIDTSHMTAEGKEAMKSLSGAAEGAVGALGSAVLITGFLIGLVIMAVINLIIAAIIKKDPAGGAA